MLAGSVLVGIVLALSGVAQPVSNALYDALSKNLAPAASKDIVIVAIDDASIDALGRWPWSRALQARMIDKLAAGHPRAIIYDVLFTEAAAGEGDVVLAHSLRTAGRVVLPALMEIPGPNGAEVAIKRPVEALERAGALVGHSNVAVDRDGVLRRVALHDAGLLHVAALAIGRESVTTPPAPALVAFSPSGAFRTIPFAALLEGDVPRSFLDGKIVIVGATAAGLGDRYATPSTNGAGLTAGVETIASIVSNILGGRLIADLGWRGSLVFVGPTLMILALSFRLLTPFRSAIVMLALVVLCIGASMMLLRIRLWCDPIPAIVALSLFFPIWGWYRLAMVSGFIDGQLVRLAADRGPFDLSRGRMTAPDRLEWRAGLLDRSIARMRDLRVFIDNSFEHLPDATLVIDQSGRIVLASKAAHDLFSSYCGIALPRSAAVALRRLKPIIVSGYADLAATTIAASARENVTADELVLTDDRTFQIEAIAFFAASSSARFTILRLSDITIRKHAERDRQRALEFLSHDIRAPQTTLLGMVAQLDARIDPATKAGITRVAQRTLSLAQSFVDIARSQSGRLDLVPTDMADIMRDSVGLLWNDFEAKGLRVTLDLPDEEALILADALLLARAFQNVLTNAARHAPAHSAIHVRIVQHAAAVDGATWRCAIDDRGAGIAPQMRDRLFTRFESDSRQSGGTGLGLSLVKAVCVAFGGNVKCYSRVGVGTRFVISLPVHETTPHADRAESAESQEGFSLPTRHPIGMKH